MIALQHMTILVSLVPVPLNAYHVETKGIFNSGQAYSTGIKGDEKTPSFRQ